MSARLTRHRTRTRIRTWALGAATLVVVLLLAACGGSSSTPSSNLRTYNTVLHLAMVTHGSPDDPFWIAAKRGAEQAAKDFNVQLEYLTSGTPGAPSESALISRATAQHQQGVALTIPDVVAEDAAVGHVADANIPLVVFNAGYTSWQTLGALDYVGQDPTVSGTEAGTEMAKYGFRHVLCVSDEAHNSSLYTRCQAMGSALATVGGTVSVVTVPSTIAAGEAAVEAALAANPGIDGIMALGPVEWEIAQKALHDHPLTNPHKLPHPLATFDATSAILQSVDHGTTLFALNQQPYLQGYLAVQVLAQQVRYGLHPYQQITTGPLLVTTNDAADLSTYALRQADPIDYRNSIYVSMVAHGAADDPFWHLVLAGAQQASKDFGVKLHWWAPNDQDQPSQATLMKEALATNPDALAVTLSNDAALREIKYAVASYRPLLVYNAGEDEYQDLGTPANGGALGFVGEDDSQAGTEAAEQLFSDGLKNVLCVVHDADNQGLVARCQALAETMAAYGGTVTTLTVDGDDQASAAKAIQAALADNPSVDSIMTLGDPGFTAANAALKASGQTGKIKIAASDTSKDILQAVINGQALFTLNQQPYLQGYYSVEILAFEARLGLHPVGVLQTGPSVVTQQDAPALLHFQNETGI